MISEGGSNMTGNILYMPYTIILIIALIIIGIEVSVKLGKRKAKIFLAIFMPIFVIIQFYFWNIEFNDYVKSYLFPSKSFVCEYTAKEDQGTSIPLPKRTVFHGKEDVCSPFYTTYISDTYFKEFYQKELNAMKNKGGIQNFHYKEQMNKKGFEVQLLSGTKVVIFIKRHDSFEKAGIKIQIDNVILSRVRQQFEKNPIG